MQSNNTSNNANSINAYNTMHDNDQRIIDQLRATQVQLERLSQSVESVKQWMFATETRLHNIESSMRRLTNTSNTSNTATPNNTTADVKSLCQPMNATLDHSNTHSLISIDGDSNDDDVNRTISYHSNDDSEDDDMHLTINCYIDDDLEVDDIQLTVSYHSDDEQ